MGRYFTGSLKNLKKFWEERGRGSFEKGYWIRIEGIKKIVHEISTLKKGLILDVGCGPGIAAGFFPLKLSVVGLDFSRPMLKSAKGRLKRLVLGNGFSLPFHDGQFDAVTCLFVASDYGDKSCILSEIFRTLKHGGSFFLSDYSPKDEHWRIRKKIREKLRQKWHIFIESDSSLKKMMESTGFKILSMKRINFSTPFELERYARSKEKIKKLMEDKNVRACCKSGKKINREFLLLKMKK